MLNQIIYTRCLPYRDLKRKGQVVRGDGFGVFSLSPEVFDNCSEEELAYINNRLAVPNAAKENAPTGLFNSYEYVLLPGGQGVLTYEVARPLCKEPRKNGKLHRGGNFIKQSLIGFFARRVTDLIESDIWDAYRTPENDYYMDDIPNPEPPMLPLIDERAFEAGISNELVQQFVHEGREKAVQRGISFIFRELDKPESERKVLLIKDEPQNVILWILAILRVFPERIANRVTFSTNKSRLGAQTDSLLFYYTDKADRVYFIKNQALGLTRHPYCMIVGYHPADVFCTNIRQNTNSDFYILDGAAKTTTIPDSYSLSGAFCEDSALVTDDYRNFKNLIYEYIPESASSAEIDKLYNAYKYIVIEDESRWTYGEALQQFQTLSRYGVFHDSELNDRLVTKVMSFIREHSRNEIESFFGLSAGLWIYAVETQNGEDLAGTVSGAIWAQYRAGYDIGRIWNKLKGISTSAIYKSILMALFSDDILPDIYGSFPRCQMKTVSILFEMFCEKLRLSGEGVRAILKNDKKFFFTYNAVYATRLNPVHARNCLKRINSDHDVFIEVATSIAKTFEVVNSMEAYKWWEIVAESAGESVLSLCAYLINAGNVQMEQIEQLLCSSVNTKKAYDEDICRAFISSKKIIQSDENSGEYLFSLLITYSGIADYAKLIRNIRIAGLDEAVEHRLFCLIDTKLDIPVPGNDNADIACEMGKWAGALQRVSQYYACYQVWQNTVHEKDEEKVRRIIREFGKYRIPYKEEYIKSQWYNDILNKTLSFESGALHMLMICFFKFASAENHKQFIQWYIHYALVNAEKRELINTMLSISYALCYDFRITVYNKEEMNVIRQTMENAFIRELMPYYSNSLINKVEKNKNYNEKTISKMLYILREVDAKRPVNEHRGILGSLFRK